MDITVLVIVLAMMVKTAGEWAVPFSGTLATFLHVVLLLALGIVILYVAAPIRHPAIWANGKLDSIIGHPRALEVTLFVVTVATAQSAGWLVATLANDPSLQNGTDRVPNTWPAVIGVLLLAPLAEELLFRGWLLRLLQRRFGPAIAVALSSVAFGVIHPWPAGAVANSVFGVFLGWLALRTGSLWPCMAAHAASNGIGLVWLHAS